MFIVGFSVTWYFLLKALVHFWSYRVHKLHECAKDTKYIMFDTPYNYVGCEDVSNHAMAIWINFIYCQSAYRLHSCLFFIFWFLAESLDKPLASWWTSSMQVKNIFWFEPICFGILIIVRIFRTKSKDESIQENSFLYFRSTLGGDKMSQSIWF